VFPDRVHVRDCGLEGFTDEDPAIPRKREFTKSNHHSSVNASIIAAFPKSLAPDVDRLAALIDPPTGLETSEAFTLACDGEPLKIPYRIYRPVITDACFSALHPKERLIAACWYTRHHDGRVRERFLRALPAFDQSWIIAYVVALCGEYVSELLDYVWHHQSLFARDTLGGWLCENSTFYARTRSRIVSYWDCYYRSEYPVFTRYVGGQITAFFEECVAEHRKLLKSTP
jgi:hypothetical protein